MEAFTSYSQPELHPHWGLGSEVPEQVHMGPDNMPLVWADPTVYLALAKETKDTPQAI